ncbi:hypothetical protein WJX72_004396 [[Myrmecia] bisecta]|uniref:Pre-mRNA processing factor 4 (PRP4)-like domain-containing protein n=1 Tax=[Myrmecia] bisecta TaxID=41462 RepID=A0AAW1PNL1_9CHLO
MSLPQAGQHAQQLQEELIRQVNERRRMRETVVPTSDADVRRMLRQMDEPITLFGEKEMERRDRLRRILSAMDEEEREAVAVEGNIQVMEEAPAVPELFYTEGLPGLKQARLQIAEFSLDRAAERLAGAKRKRESADEDEAGERQAAVEAAKAVIQQSSEIGDERPISSCAFQPGGRVLATAAWSGLVKLWGMPGGNKQLTIKAHDDRITGIAWHPDAGFSQSPDSVNLVTASADTTARLWSADGRLLRSLTGHADRLGRVAYHPMGCHVGTASFDQTWRLWDAETGTCILEQEGHSRSVYAVAFHRDGSLAGSGGLDAVGRIWDLRTGRTIMTLEGHVKDILSLDFSPNGYHVATGSNDNSCRIWDLRKRKAVYTLPGHRSLISQVTFEPNDGYYLLTAGYDNTSKLWDTSNYQLIKTLAGHEGKVMGADICPDGSGLIATVSYDRTVKLWAPDEV